MPWIILTILIFWAIIDFSSFIIAATSIVVLFLIGCAGSYYSDKKKNKKILEKCIYLESKITSTKQEYIQQEDKFKNLIKEKDIEISSLKKEISLLNENINKMNYQIRDQNTTQITEINQNNDLVNKLHQQFSERQAIIKSLEQKNISLIEENDRLNQELTKSKNYIKTINSKEEDYDCLLRRINEHFATIQKLRKELANYTDLNQEGTPTASIEDYRRLTLKMKMEMRTIMLNTGVIREVYCMLIEEFTKFFDSKNLYSSIENKNLMSENEIRLQHDNISLRMQENILKEDIKRLNKELQLNKIESIDVRRELDMQVKSGYNAFVEDYEYKDYFNYGYEYDLKEISNKFRSYSSRLQGYVRRIDTLEKKLKEISYSENEKEKIRCEALHAENMSQQIKDKLSPITPPLSNRIEIDKKLNKYCNAWVVGSRFYGKEAQNVISNKLKIGDELTLICEKNHPKDPNAIEVYAFDTKLGYISSRDAVKIRQIMDEGRFLKSIVAEISSNYERIHLEASVYYIQIDKT